jgi:hypothetical protein
MDGELCCAFLVGDRDSERRVDTSHLPTLMIAMFFTMPNSLKQTVGNKPAHPTLVFTLR